MFVPLGLRRIILLWLPPIIVEAIRYLRRSCAKLSPASGARQESSDSAMVPEWEMVPDTDEVWKRSEGWSHRSIAQIQLGKWKDFLATVESTQPFGQSHEASANALPNIAAHNTILSFGYALGRAINGHKRISVLDWGGGLGHYYVYARKLYPEISFDFVVKDLPELCQIGKTLLPDVTFVSDEQQALSRQYDFVFASSSLHYARDHYGLLGRLCESAGNWLMITRTPIVERSDDFLVVQRPHMYGYMTEYPGWFMNRRRLIGSVTDRKFRLEREFLVGEQPNVSNAPEKAQYFGYLFCRAESA